MQDKNINVNITEIHLNNSEIKVTSLITKEDMINNHKITTSLPIDEEVSDKLKSLIFFLKKSICSDLNLELNLDEDIDYD